MPEGLQNHVRYPADMLLVQGLVYAKYHMTDPTVFYNQEDLWVRATEKYYTHVQPVEPYYVMWHLPGTNKMQFSLILPFTPKTKCLLAGLREYVMAKIMDDFWRISFRKKSESWDPNKWKPKSTRILSSPATHPLGSTG